MVFQVQLYQYAFPPGMCEIEEGRIPGGQPVLVVAALIDSNASFHFISLLIDDDSVFRHFLSPQSLLTDNF